jgi:hypothetical protein
MAKSKAGLLSGLALALLFGGCQKQTAIPAEQIEAYATESQKAMGELEAKAKILERELDRTNARLDSLEAADENLNLDLTATYALPEQNKTKLLADVDNRAADILAEQNAIQANVTKQLDDADSSLTRYFRKESDQLHASLHEQDTFFRYFFTQQDSVNGEIAFRFDKKPWYTSIIGGWSKK